MFAEVPNAYFTLADASNYHARPPYDGSAYDFVVIHITSGRANPIPVARMWQQPKHGSSAHFVVGQDGTVIQCVPLLYAAYHAHSANGRSVGIEHCAREPNEPSFPKNDPGLPPTIEQYTASAKLVAYLLKAAGLPVQKGVTIKGHAEADPATTHTGCPDAAPWDWNLYLKLVNAAYDQLGKPPAIV
jgi:N-acetyl-anhydromuramyl-L-alanine amidase AmpD